MPFKVVVRSALDRDRIPAPGEIPAARTVLVAEAEPVSRRLTAPESRETAQSDDIATLTARKQR